MEMRDRSFFPLKKCAFVFYLLREERRLSSFTPHTYSMGLMLRHLHNDLLAVLSQETQPAVLAGALKVRGLPQLARHRRMFRLDFHVREMIFENKRMSIKIFTC
jgi:hypothetical protein